MPRGAVRSRQSNHGDAGTAVDTDASAVEIGCTGETFAARRLWAVRARRGALLVAALLAAVLAAACVPAVAVVSLEFDDTLAEQIAARPILADHRMHATFFVNSGRLGRPGYLTVAELRDLEADGHEIGGHTLDHPRLTELPPKEQRRQICDDRRALLAMGFAVHDFAYPAGAYDSVSAELARACGYESARTAGGLGLPSCIFCTHAEAIPARDLFATRTSGSLRLRHDLPTIQGLVRGARQDAGWMQLVFHHICDGCDDYSISEEKLSTLLDWLEQERETRRAVVLTVREVVRGAEHLER
jgi:hypothetical protein